MKNDSLIAAEFVAQGRSEDCPVIDMHGHYGPFRGIYFPSPYADGMLHTMDRCGVKSIVVAGHAALVEPERGNRIVAEVIRMHSGRFFGYRAVNPNYPASVSREVERFSEDADFVGFKFHPSWHQYPLTGEAYKPALEYANDHNLLVLSHTWGFSEVDGPRFVGELATAYPRVTFIMGHAGYGEWEVSFAVAREHENCYLDLTAAYREGGIIEQMVETVGSHKILFGTDLPWFDPHYGIGAVCFSHITDEDRHNILHRNAEHLLARLRG